MRLIFRGVVAAGLVTALVAGCGSSPGAAGSYADARPIDVVVGSEAPASDGGAEVIPPAPMAGQGSVRLFTGPARMLANGPTCTNEAGATSDRWCAFTSKSPTSLGGIDLFVVNVSRAAAGAVIACGAAVVDANCLKLTAGFMEESVAPIPHAAGFQGDTLIYFDKTGAGYGWRPGMGNGRLLATGLPHGCFASPKGNAVLCLRDVIPQPDPTFVTSEFLVGHLDAAADPPLTRIDTVIWSDTTVGADQQRFRIGFRPDGDYVAWSSRAQAGGPEILKTQQVGDDSTRVTVATDVSRWSLSPDGTRWYWLSQFNYDPTANMPSGILQTAPFPAGTAPTTLAAGVGQFIVTHAGALVMRTGMMGNRGTLQAIPDPVRTPDGLTTLDTGVLGYAGIGPLGHVVYAKSSDLILPLFDLYVRTLDGQGSSCTLTDQTVGRSTLFFPPSGGAVIWASVTNLLSPSDTSFKFRVSYTRLSDCTTSTVADDVTGFGIAGEGGVLFEDQSAGTTGTLHLQGIAPGYALGGQPPILIQTRVADYLPLIPNPGVIVYTVSVGSAADGFYLHPASAVPDDGAADAGASESGVADGANAASTDGGG